MKLWSLKEKKFGVEPEYWSSPLTNVLNALLFFFGLRVFHNVYSDCRDTGKGTLRDGASLFWVRPGDQISKTCRPCLKLFHRESFSKKRVRNIVINYANSYKIFLRRNGIQWLAPLSRLPGVDYTKYRDKAHVLSLKRHCPKTAPIEIWFYHHLGVAIVWSEEHSE